METHRGLDHHHLRHYEFTRKENDTINKNGKIGNNSEQEMTSILAKQDKNVCDFDTSESLVEDVIGCGPFQGMIILLVTILTKVPAAGTFMFMSFGNYNPGWRCLDNFSININGSINDTTNTLPVPDYTAGTCEDYEACKKVQFNPDSSTITTEWGLLCDRSWIASLIISIQMVGALIGSGIAGHLGDAFGRKTVVYSCIATMSVVNLASMFSTSWQMFAALRFFLGAAASSLLALYYVLTNEFLPYKWRGPNNAIPAWNIGTIIFGVLAYVFRDWKTVHLCLALICVICFIPVFWVPESIRWLAVKQKNEEFTKVVIKMAKLNKKSPPSDAIMKKIVTKAAEDHSGSKNYTVFDLLHPSVRRFTFIFSLIWMSFSVIYYGISFGVKNLYGDFYLNLILLFALEMPFAIFPSFVPNLMGRVKGGFLFVSFAVICILTCAGLEIWGTITEKAAGSIIILLAKVTLNSGWCIHIMQLTEFYPTVVRGLSLGWGCLMARVGGIIAPFIIPNNKSALYIPYIAMTVLASLICVGIILFPETKGRPLRDNLDDDGNDYNDENAHVDNGESSICNPLACDVNQSAKCDNNLVM